MQSEEKKSPKSGSRTLSIVTVVVVAITVVAAVVIVARNADKIVKPQVPPGLPDPGLQDPDIVRFPKTMLRRLAKLDKRYQKYGNREDLELSSEQESLRVVCDSAFDHVRAQVAVFDTLSDRAMRVQHAKDVTQMYKDLKRPVRAFARTFVEADQVDPDSLDLILQQLLSQ
ncbi:MAG: hypothetical protein JSU73_10660 [candidate division WOR-3 bacterium]|nr:MAG: hypothetical protein JSU73_10660 [candidate division WOR-3 bacterium]